MKRPFVILGLAVAAAVLGYVLVGLRHSADDRTLAGATGSDLAWLRAEFGLDEKQFAAVSALHEAYAPACARHCADVVAAEKRLEALRQAGAPAADLDSARRDIAHLQEVCNAATHEHVRKVATLMPPGQGGRFLAMIEPHLAQLPHDPAQRSGGMAH